MNALSRVVAAAAIFGAMLGTVAAQTLNMLAPFPASQAFHRDIAVPFAQAVGQASGGKMTVRISGPDVAPPFEQLQLVQSGAFQLLFSLPAYHTGATTFGVAFDAISGSPTVLREAGLVDAADRFYAKLGLKVLAMVPTSLPDQVGHLMLRRSIDPANGLKGLKIRSTPPMHPMVTALGGTPVVLSPGEVYAALQKGVVDGAFWAVNGTTDLKWHEVAPYMTRPTFGSIRLWIYMNRAAWDGLDSAQRDLLQAKAREIELAAESRFARLQRDEETKLAGLGVQIMRFSDADAARLPKLWSEGLWQIAGKSAAAEVADVRRMARTARLAD